MCELFPYPLTYVLTDNGSEVMKHIDQELRWLHKVHWHTYPKTPRMNVHAERFNRTIQEEFLLYPVPQNAPCVSAGMNVPTSL